MLWPLRLLARHSILVCGLLALPAHARLRAQEAAQDPVLSWMNGIAQRQLRQRSEIIGQIHTVAEADKRKQTVRAELMKSLGGLPDYNGPLNARELQANAEK